MAITDNLISYYKMDESSGSVLDAHGSNNGTNNGATPNVTGKINTAYDFEETESDYIALTDMNYVTANRLSVQAWIKIESLDEMQIVTHSTNTSVRAFLLEVSSSSKARFVQWNSSGTARAIATTFSLNTGQWYHMIGIWDGTNIILYVDGVKEAETAQSGTIRNDTGALQIGRNLVSGFYFDGVIDEVAIWKKALTDGGVNVGQTAGGEIAELYNSGAGLAYPFVAVGTNMQLNIADAWKEVPAIQINIADSWKPVTGAQLNIGDAWKEIF